MRQRQRDYEQRHGDRIAKRRATHAYRGREREAQADAHRRRQGRLNVLKGGPCVDCGETFPPAAMQFDHVRGIKKYHISANVMCRSDLEEELAKCELRCANCHAIRHAGLREVVGVDEVFT